MGRDSVVDDPIRSLADSLPSMVWFAATDAQCTYFNKAWLEYRGRSLEEESGNGWIEGVHADDRTGCFEAFISAFHRRDSFEIRYRLKRFDGHFHWVVDRGAPWLESDGRFAGFVGLTDLAADADRRYLRDPSRQAEKMEVLGRLAGGVAHDFNNLLTVITVCSDMALGQIAQGDPARNLLEEIRIAGARAALLTSQLLAFSRKQTLRPQGLDLNAIVTRHESMLGGLLGGNIRLTFLLESELGRVEADPDQISQIIMNLAANARDAMPHGGKLIIETANVECDEATACSRAGAKPGLYVMLAVSDTGLGMDEDSVLQIFEPFFTTKDHEKGTGLGLAMVYGVIKQSGGFIDVESEPGRGAIFRLYLPRTDQPLSPEARNGPRRSY